MSDLTSPADDRYADVDLRGAPGWLAAKLIGPYIAGYSTHLLLVGLFAQQFFSFCSSGDFSRLPRKASKVALAVLFAMELLYTGIIWWEQFTISIKQGRTVEDIIQLDAIWNALPLLAGWIGAFTQGFLAVRAASFISSRSCKIAFYSWIAFLVVVGLFGSTTTCALGTLWYIRGGLAVLPIGWNNAVAVWLASAAAADLSISIALAISLHQRRAGFSAATDWLLGQLMWVGLRTAAYTAILSLAAAVVAACFTDGEYATTNIVCALWLPLPALYGISLFTTVTSSRRAIAASIGCGPSMAMRDSFVRRSVSGVAVGGAQDLLTDYTGFSARRSIGGGAFGDESKRDSIRFGGVVSGVPNVTSITPLFRAPTAGAPRPPRDDSSSPSHVQSRNSGKFSIKVTREVERCVEDAAYEEIRVGLGKEEEVRRWLKRELDDDEQVEDSVFGDKSLESERTSLDRAVESV
ncbi:hypothetical protein JCM11251_007391 [Rhodosporidiobolus azoricus]